jgi:Ca-activated chloride channel family protein
MSFAWPDALLGLLLVPILAAAYAWMQRNRRRYPLRYSSTSLVRQAVESSGLRRHAPAALYLLGLSAMFVALARPTATVISPQSNATVILAVDVSGSMRSADVRPTRIDAAKAAVRDFVKKQPKGVKIGLVAFAEEALLVTPPTTDKQQVIKAVDTLALGRGTNIGDGLRLALAAILEPDQIEFGFGPAASTTPTPASPSGDPETSVIVLLSDGAATTGPAPLKVADEVAQSGVKTYTVGLGTVSNFAPQTGGFGGRFMELDEATLKGIADKTGGEYFSAQNAGQLHNIYGELTRKEHFVTDKTEVTFLATGVALLFMVAGTVAAILWSGRLP